MALSHIGIDIGGTFTDIVAYDEERGEFTYLKLSSSVNPEESVISGLEQIRSAGREPDVLFHSTTVATNALLERKGWPKVGLIMTSGFRDVLEIGRQNRPELYNLRTERPKPIVPRYLRYTIDEKCTRGRIEKGVDEAEIAVIAQQMKTEGVEIACISLMNSYSNPSNEHAARRLLRKHIDVPVICSSDIDPLPKEFERTSTSAVNALLYPIVSTYLSRLRGLIGSRFGAIPIYIMQSDGGATTINGAIEKPISIIESGPASGVVSALYLGNLLGKRNLLTFDMGGTTAKAGIIQNGAVEYSHEFEAAGKTHSGRAVRGSGYPVRFPFIDLAETSSGGGSIAWIDAGNALRVGPVSAGSQPGPACYGRGGTEPTITDANLVTGRLEETSLLSGRMRISRSMAEEAIRRNIADRLSIGTVEGGMGIIAIAANQMAKVMRIVSVERGYDPRRFELVAFGGAGPLHAVDVAQSLGIGSIIVPSSPGLFSAYGLITVDLKREYRKALMKTAADMDGASLAEGFREIEEKALETAESEGWNRKAVSFLRSVSAQYSSQGWELTIPVRMSGRKGSEKMDMDGITSDFHSRHRQVYGYASPSDPVNIVSLNLTSLISLAKPKHSSLRKGGVSPSSAALKEERSVYFTGMERKSRVFVKERLAAGNIIRGPAVIEQYDSTTLVPPGWKALIDRWGDIMLRGKA